MDTLRIDTTQNIDIEQPIASIAERIVATIIDLLFMFAYLILLTILDKSLYSKTLMGLSLILLLPVLLYSLISELLMDGQSWGKKIMKIKVVKIDGTPVTFVSYFLRWITRIIEIYGTSGALGTITIILNKKGQRLGDMAANTTVIRVREKKLDEISLMKIPENYQVVFPQVSELSMNDINTIQEVLHLLRLRNRDRNTMIISSKTRQAIERKLGIQSDMNNLTFFQTILRDYSFINTQS